MDIVVALGGNALQKGGSLEPLDQLLACRKTAKSIVKLIKKGHKLAIVHGNGPQVGEISASIETANSLDKHYPHFPFDVFDAFTQGYIGYHLQNSITNELNRYSIDKKAVSIVTQVKVDKNDLAFKNPTKPIGGFYSKTDAKEMMAKLNIPMTEDSNRGWRKVIASPKPLDIVEKNTIKTIFNSGDIVIACGGGGIPVVSDKEHTLSGIEAVIDKDLSASKLAQIINADMLMILTAIDKVYINFSKPNQKALNKTNTKELENFIKKGYFAKGSMLPKVEAVIGFIKGGKNKKAVIASLDDADDVFNGAGTWIYD